MKTGLIGRKVGMTRVFHEDGASLPVTVIKVEKNKVVQIKNKEADGYSALQLSSGEQLAQNKVTKSQSGHYSKASTQASPLLVEFRVNSSELTATDDEVSIKLGDEFSVSIFEAGEKVDVTAKSKGKGFTGVIKRWNFSTQDMSHGNSLSHRAPGSIGQCQTPGRVWKGKKMAGQHGNKSTTVQSLEIVQVDEDNNLLLLKGAVPGAKGSSVIVKPAVKAN